MSSAQDIVGGYETARVSAADADARQQRRVAARSYLDRLHPQEVADELADILGLDTEQAVTHSVSFVTANSAGTVTADSPESGGAPEIQRPAAGPAGLCSWCGRTYQLTRHGHLRWHKAWVIGRGGITRIDSECVGSGGLPEDS